MGVLLKILLVSLFGAALTAENSEPYRPNYKQIPPRVPRQYPVGGYNINDPCCPTNYNPVICRNPEVTPYRQQQQQVVYQQQPSYQQTYRQQVPSYNQVVYPQQSHVSYQVVPQPRPSSQVVTYQVPNYNYQQTQVPSYTHQQVQVPSYTHQQVQIPSYTHQQIPVPSYTHQQVPSYTQQLQVPEYTQQQIQVPSYSQQKVVYQTQPIAAVASQPQQTVTHHVSQVPTQQKIVTYAQQQPAYQQQAVSYQQSHGAQPNQVVYKQGQPSYTSYTIPTYNGGQSYNQQLYGSQPFVNRRTGTDPYANIPVEIIDVDDTRAYRSSQSDYSKVRSPEETDESSAENKKEEDYEPYKIVASSKTDYTVQGGQTLSNSVSESKPISTTITRSFRPSEVADENEPVHMKFVNGQEVFDNNANSAESTEATTTEVEYETTTLEAEDDKPGAVVSWFN